MNSNKHTYTVTTPDGGIITRTTNRTYTHVIMCKIATSNGEHWRVDHWCGSLALAQKYNYGQLIAVNNPR